MIDSIVTDGGKVVPRKRRYNANWFADFWENRDGKAIYAEAATVLQKELEAAHHWDGLTKSDLISFYSGAYIPEYTITFFRRIHAGTIDWRASLLNSNLNSLYRTTFVYSMVYVSPEHVHLFVGAN